MMMPGRTYSGSGYRFGYNGKEMDNETYGNGNEYDYGARILDPRLGRWLSIDPLQQKYIGMSPYNFVLNNPVVAKDPDGKKVYLVIEEMEIRSTNDGDNLEYVPTGKLLVLDVTSKEDMNKMTDDRNDQAMASYYQGIRNTSYAGQKISEYEQSETNDVYIFQDSKPLTNMDRARQGQMEYAVTIPKIADFDKDGKFSASDIPPEEIQNIDVLSEAVGKINERLVYKNPNANISLISINQSALNPALDDLMGDNSNCSLKERNEIGIAHEFIAHIEGTENNIRFTKQHDEFYGKKGGNPNNFEPNSEYGKTLDSYYCSEENCQDSK